MTYLLSMLIAFGAGLILGIAASHDSGHRQSDIMSLDNDRREPARGPEDIDPYLWEQCCDSLSAYMNDDVWLIVRDPGWPKNWKHASNSVIAIAFDRLANDVLPATLHLHGMPSSARHRAMCLILGTATWINEYKKMGSLAFHNEQAWKYQKYLKELKNETNDTMVDHRSTDAGCV